MTSSVLDVVDGFFEPSEDIATVPGARLFEFGAEVRRWAAAHDPEIGEEHARPSYIGGWPSANAWDASTGQLSLTSLLYCGQLVARDPLVDWFSPDRYRVRMLMQARSGFLVPETGEPNVAGTRAYLRRVLPGLEAMRPLIESKAVALVPSRSFLADERALIERLRDELLARILPDPESFCRRFGPADLAVEDNVRGFFVFAGGERREQISKAVSRSLEFFAGEYLLARGLGAEYVAAFPYEQYLCESGIEPSLLEAPGARVVHAVLRSSLPLFSGLSPAVVAEIRDDDAFGEFRGALYELYRDVPFATDPSTTEAAIAEAEGALLAPRLARIRKDADRGLLARAGLALAGPVVRLATSLGFDLATGHDPAVALARGGLSEVASAATRSRGGRTTPTVERIWSRLYDHHRSISDEVPAIEAPPTGGSPSSEYWAIPDAPTMEVFVSAGVIVAESLSGAQWRKVGRNEPCPCGSGLKYKRCCESIRIE